jgi:hypothetical protein
MQRRSLGCEFVRVRTSGRASSVTASTSRSLAGCIRLRAADPDNASRSGGCGHVLACSAIRSRRVSRARAISSTGPASRWLRFSSYRYARRPPPRRAEPCGRTLRARDGCSAEPGRSERVDTADGSSTSRPLTPTRPGSAVRGRRAAVIAATSATVSRRMGGGGGALRPGDAPLWTKRDVRRWCGTARQRSARPIAITPCGS